MEDAIAAHHNTELDGRKISVKHCIPQVWLGDLACRACGWAPLRWVLSTAREPMDPLSP